MFQPGTLPKTIFRKMLGFYYDDQCNNINLSEDSVLNDMLQLSGFNKIVIKPSVDSQSGKGVKLFEKKDNEWTEIGGNCKLEYYNILMLNLILIIVLYGYSDKP